MHRQVRFYMMCLHICLWSWLEGSSRRSEAEGIRCFLARLFDFRNTICEGIKASKLPCRWRLAASMLRTKKVGDKSGSEAVHCGAHSVAPRSTASCRVDWEPQTWRNFLRLTPAPDEHQPTSHRLLSSASRQDGGHCMVHLGMRKIVLFPSSFPCSEQS